MTNILVHVFKFLLLTVGWLVFIAIVELLLTLNSHFVGHIHQHWTQLLLNFSKHNLTLFAGRFMILVNQSKSCNSMNVNGFSVNLVKGHIKVACITSHYL